MKDILWGVYPELNQAAVRNYAASYLNRHAVLPQEQNVASGIPEGVGTPLAIRRTYDPNAAVAYAYQWAEHGGGKRNSAYPDFADTDCTNFISQVVQVGGVPLQGSGSCSAKGGVTEWYANESSWWCLANRWAWSTSWSVVPDFWSYHSQNSSNATFVTFPSTDFNQLDRLRAVARPGDIIQVQDATGGAKWHSVLVTRKDTVTDEIYLT